MTIFDLTGAVALLLLGAVLTLWRLPKPSRPSYRSDETEGAE